MNRIRCILVGVLVLTLGSTAWAQLQPDEVAILVNKASKSSRQIAAYYARQRGIPTTHLCEIEMPITEELDRATWNKTVRPAVRRWIATNKLQDKVRCFVTTWDVPLKIGKEQPVGSATRRRISLLNFEKERRMRRLLEFMDEFDKIQASGDALATTADSGLTVDSPLQQVTEGISLRLKGAESRIKDLPAGDEKQAAINRLTQLSVAAAGLQVLTQNMQRAIENGNGNERIQKEVNFGRGRLTGFNEAQSLISGLPPSIERDTNSIVLIERAAGIVGTITWIDRQLKDLADNETYSSFDSELSLVMESDYSVYRWLPNYLHYNYDDAPIRKVTRTLMVSRLEAPTLPLTKSLIDNAIRIEKEGLSGKVYLDARGAAKVDGQYGVGSIEDYDRSILLTHKLLTEHTSLDVVLNSSEELFQAGDCPDTALYCGWVSLAQYVDAFEWKPGSFGYHMSSSEAQTLRRPDSQVWCKRMLDEGISATIGPVYEPYLLAFPRPNELFAVLLTGRYTYVEAMYRTKTTNSWVMTTIGDPLYNPFKAKPALTEAPIQYRRIIGIPSK